jgi:UDP-GlcNAc:undecaprenyl-phosphate GlcNAc-1-phosphate transferase
VSRNVSLAFGVVLAGAALAAWVVPFSREAFRKWGWVDHPAGRKSHHHPTPLAGGLAVLSGFGAALALLAWMGRLGFPFAIPATMGGGLAGCAVALFLLGLWDDVVELRPAAKLGGQLLVGCGVVLAGARLPWGHDWPVVQIALSLFFFVATVNAVNFLDNMNGLCAGLGSIAALQIGWFGCRWGQPEIGFLAWGLAGACAGFLPYNFPRASVFLGDSGSQMIGGLLAMLTMWVCTSAWGAVAEGTGPAGSGGAGGAWKAWLPLSVLAVPGYDSVQVVLGRLRRGQPVYVGDHHHVSHQLTRRGLTRSQAVLVLWVLAMLAGGVGLALS